MPNPYKQRTVLKSPGDVETRLADTSLTWSDVAVQGVDLTADGGKLATRDLTGCVFLGCVLPPKLGAAAAKAQRLVIPPIAGMPFNAFRTELYTSRQLYDRFELCDPQKSYQESLDYLICESSCDPTTHVLYKPVPVEIALARRVHDQSISVALDEFIEQRKSNPDFKGLVGVMGGHDMPRIDKDPENPGKDSPYMSIQHRDSHLVLRARTSECFRKPHREVLRE